MRFVVLCYKENFNQTLSKKKKKVKKSPKAKWNKIIGKYKLETKCPLLFPIKIIINPIVQFIFQLYLSLGPSLLPITPNNNINGTTTSTRLCFNSSYQTEGLWKIRLRVTTSFSSHPLIHFLCFLVLLFLFVKFVGGSNCLYSFFSWFRCEHYKRRCKIRAPCCNQIFPCRHCHNEVTVSFYTFLCMCVCWCLCVN